jgi:DNA-binding MarR family transcriptional regulator
MSRRSPAGAPPQSQLGFLASDVLRLLRADFASRARDMPLTPALHRLLYNVKRHPGCRQVELAEWLEVTPVTVGRMIDRLEKLGLVRREDEPGDRRVSRVFVSPNAGPLLAQIDATAEQTRERAFRGMSTAQRVALLGALAQLRDNLQPEPAPTATTITTTTVTATRRRTRGR